MTTEQLKLAVKAQTLLEMVENSTDKDFCLQKARECINKLIAEESTSFSISTTNPFNGGSGSLIGKPTYRDSMTINC